MGILLQLYANQPTSVDPQNIDSNLSLIASCPCYFYMQDNNNNFSFFSYMNQIVREEHKENVLALSVLAQAEPGFIVIA